MSVTNGMLPILIVLLAAGDVLSQTSQPTESPTPTTQPAGAALRGPQYAPLRYDDDFSYLDGPAGSYREDFFDPIKRIHLGEDLTVSLGGEIRGRLEAVTRKRYGAEDPTQDTFFLHRYYYHADIQYRKLARFFVQGISAWAEDPDGTPIPAPANRFDAHQMFIDLRVLGEDVPLTMRFGRQELQYGKQRLVSPLDWANVRRAWDGLKLFWRSKDLDIDAWYARPVVVRNYSPDRYDEDVHFYGLYSTWKGIPNHGIDAYLLALRNTGSVASANNGSRDRFNFKARTGDLSLYTPGTRFWGKQPIGSHAWDYETELAAQWGQIAGDRIQAMMWAADTGYTLGNLPWQPRIGVGIDYASGDDYPFDGTHQTFNQLFPLGHAFLGYLDQIGRQNIWAQNVNLTLKPHAKVTTQLAWHTFWLDKSSDALFNAGGGAVRRQVNGRVGEEIGHELDWTLQWQIDAHTTLLFGYSHLWASDFIHETGISEDPDLLYLQYTFKF